MTNLARVTSRGQTTIPRAVRDALHVKPGDVIIWEVNESGRAEVRRVEPIDVAYLQSLESTLSEWESAEDDDAYRDL